MSPKVARRLERRLEKFVESIASAVFGGGLQPIDLANRLVREADLAIRSGPTGPVCPNVFSLRIHPDEIDPQALDADLAKELEFVIEQTAEDRGWRLEGPPRVDLSSDRSVADLACDTNTQPGPLEPWGVITADGHKYHLTHNRELLGRADHVDIRLPSSHVSREHALIFRESGSIWIDDRGSSNGTCVDGVVIDRPTVLMGDEALLFGATAATFRRV